MSRSCIFPIAAAIGGLAGCAVTQPGETPPAPALAPAEPSAATQLEAATLARAKAAVRGGDLADALVRWQLLSLLNPENHEYRSAIARTRREIRIRTQNWLALADQARKRGNVRQATENYLRVLNVDRQNVRAAQGLREMERERTRRAYLNRPPRVAVPE